MEIFLSQIYNKEISLILEYLSTNTNLLITSTDEFVIDAVLGNLKVYYENIDWGWEDVETKKIIPDNTIVIIKIDGNTTISNSTLLYYYLELVQSQKFKVIFVTQNSLAIDNMEKRIKSRFSNHVYVLRPLNFVEYLALYKYLVYTEPNHIFTQSLNIWNTDNDESLIIKNNSSNSLEKKSTYKEAFVTDFLNKIMSENEKSLINGISLEEERSLISKVDSFSSELANVILCKNINTLKNTSNKYKNSKSVLQGPKVSPKKYKLSDDKGISIQNQDKLHFKNLSYNKNKEVYKDNMTEILFNETDFSRKMMKEENLVKVYCQYELSADVLQLANLYAQIKYNFDEFKLESCLEILDIIHLAILLMCSIEKVTFCNVTSQFKKFVLTCKELKGSSNDEIFRAFCEVREYKLVNEKGHLLINETCLRKFINSSHRPHFLKSLLNKSKL